MGLEGVEIVMAVEERFDIAIEDAEAEQTVTPGRLIDLILSKVGRTGEAACLTQRAFHRLRAALMRQSGWKRYQIRPELALAELFPRKDRRERLGQLLDAIGIHKTIELVRPDWLLNTILAMTFIGGIATGGFLHRHPVTSTSLLIHFITASPVIAAIVFMAAFGWLAFFLTRPARREFRPHLKFVGDLSRWIMANAPEVVKAPPGQWSREQVSAIVKEIVLEHLDCEKAYREDAEFIKDLGLG